VTSVALVLGPPLALAALVALTLAWIAQTDSGTRAALKLASALIPALTIEQVDGHLTGALRIGRLRVEAGTSTVTIEGLALEPRALQWRPARFEFARAAAQRVAVEWTPSKAPATPPASLATPVEVVVDALRIDTLAVGARGATPTVVRSIDASGSVGPQGIDVQRLTAALDRVQLTAAGQVAGAPPFATRANATLATETVGKPLTLRLAASGSLQDLAVTLAADDAGTQARGEARVHAFAEPPLERLQLDVRNFDPSHWVSGAPSMQLTGRADLAPAARPGAFALVGTFEVANATAGPLDRARVPVNAVRGSLDWSADTLALVIERADVGSGRASGTLDWSPTAGVKAQLDFSGIDLAVVDGRAARTRANGRVDYEWTAEQQRFSGTARNTAGLPLAAEASGTLRDQVLEIPNARLQLGQGRAEVRGRLELGGARTLRASGRFTDLDLARLVPGWQTRLNGTAEVDGRLQSRTGTARFQLADSRIAGRPVTGGGSVALAQNRLDADIELRSGDARASARGGLGDGRSVKLDVTVPELAALVPGFAGAVALDAAVSGELASASAEGRVTASRLALPGGQKIAQLTAAFAGGRAADAPLALRVDASGHSHPSGPDASLAAATLIGRGTTADMTLELTGRTAAEQPLRAIAHGGLKDSVWRGTLAAAEIGAPLDLLLQTPTPVAVGAGTFEFGPADFTLRGARFAAVEAKRADGRWRTAGTFTDMQPQALDAQARAPRRVVRTGRGDRVPLTLAGRWNLELGERGVSGIAIVERTGGDLYSGVDGLAPIGVSDVGAALNVVDNRVTGNVYLRGRALGNVDAAVDAWIDPAMPDGRVLAQQRPFSIVVDAALPDLSWLGPLIGDSVQFGGRGSVNAVIGGTPAEPTSSGTLRAEALRLAWVDQGVRLENGNFDAVLEDGVLVIREAVFTGNPRVAPGNLRALEGLQSDRPFEMRAVGRIALATMTGSIGVQATQLPVLQRADRWLVASGSGGVTLTPERAELYAKLTVDGAFFDFDTARGARALPADVTVVRAGDARRAPAAAPLDVRIDLQASLGQHFYIEGTGLETRLTGALAVTGRPAQLRGEGSVQTVDGVFAGYGQRLAVRRGIVTFQGPIENPALNVLAVRTGLPVEVGVAVTGTAQRPLVRLFSDPAMSDAEKLNWLVLGRPPGPNDGNDRALLTAAASALFAGQTDRATSGLMKSLGIDQITLQSGQSAGSLLPRETVAGRLRSSGGTTTTTAATEFLAVGKRINENLFISFEQALTGAEYFVALSYRLTRQISVIARAGSTNSIDLVYSVAFD
jgi:translocation and assembly module TamB